MLQWVTAGFWRFYYIAVGCQLQGIELGCCGFRWVSVVLFGWYQFDLVVILNSVSGYVWLKRVMLGCSGLY